MNIDELLLSINDSTFDDVVCQTDVQTEADKAEYQSRGYSIMLTESEFREKFSGVDPKCVYYSTSMSLSSFYFNTESLAICPFHLEIFVGGASGHFKIEDCYRAFASCEKEVAEGNYRRSLFNLPDRMRLEYFGKLYQKFGRNIPNLYRLFFETYTESDYGFNGLDKELMSAILDSKTDEDREKTAQAVSALPDIVTIYRGGNTASADYHEAYSWTLDINVANFFASRRGSHTGYIVGATVKKSDIIDAFLDDRSEEEIIVDPKNITVVKEIPVHGIDFLKEVLPKVNPIYHEYRDKLYDLRFSQKSSIHGKEHEARVLILTQIISYMLDLPIYERKILATAAIYHDTKRINDDVDECHGKCSRDYYHRDVVAPNYLVEFLCEYHCLPDERGYAEIQNNKKLKRNRSLATRLLQVFKDADGLDRLRLGSIRELDLNQLRLDVSKELTLVARMCLEQIKV